MKEEREQLKEFENMEKLVLRICLGCAGWIISRGCAPHLLSCEDQLLNPFHSNKFLTEESFHNSNKEDIEEITKSINLAVLRSTGVVWFGFMGSAGWPFGPIWSTREGCQAWGSMLVAVPCGLGLDHLVSDPLTCIPYFEDCWSSLV